MPEAGDAVHLAVHVARGRWFTLFASFLIMASSGATYIFSAYSEAIKSALAYDQRTLNTLSFFKDLGANVGVLPGLINEFAPPSAVLATGAVMNLSGYLMIYLAVAGRIRPRVWQMCLSICVGANSQAFANTGAAPSSPASATSHTAAVPSSASSRASLASAAPSSPRFTSLSTAGTGIPNRSSSSLPASPPLSRSSSSALFAT